MNRTEFYEINRILYQWNPLCLPDFIAKSEYMGYIPKIVKDAKTYEDIFCNIKSVLLEDLNLIFYEDDYSFMFDIRKVSKKINTIINKDMYAP